MTFQALPVPSDPVKLESRAPLKHRESMTLANPLDDRVPLKSTSNEQVSHVDHEQFPSCSIRSNHTAIDPSTLSEEKIMSGRGTTYPGDQLLLKQSPGMPPPKKVMKLVGQAIKDWSMIQEGDRLLLGLSGGKDSLALLHILLAVQKRAPVKFSIACATVDPQTDSFDPSSLIPYVQSLGITYHYLSEPIVALAKTK